MSEIRPSVEVTRDITSAESQMNSTNRTLLTLEKPFDTLKSLDKQIEDLKSQIEKEIDESIVARLKRQLESVSYQIDRVKRSITKELEQKINDTKINLERLNGRLKDLKKELDFVLKVEEEQKIRNSKTVVRLINIGQLLGNNEGSPQSFLGNIEGSSSSLSLTGNQGQRIEYLRSVDSGNLYMKLSKIGTTEEFEGTIKSINYRTIFVQEEKFIEDVSLPELPVNPKPEVPIIVFPKSEASVSEARVSNGSETIYYTQVMDFQTTLRLSLSLGFVAVDIDRQDGDLSVWVLLSSGRKFAAS